MTKSFIEIKSQLKKSGNESSFIVLIEPPETDPESGDYYCHIVSSGAIEYRLDAYGTTPQQAIKLALEMTVAKLIILLSQDETDDSNANIEDRGTP